MELQIFAEEMFYYVLDNSEPRDIPLPLCLGDMMSTHFSPLIGKAVLYTCYEKMILFKRILRKHHSFLLQDRLTFFSFIAHCGFQLYKKRTGEKIFESVLNLSAFLLTVTAFCHEKKLVQFKDFGPLCWAEIFAYCYSEDFFKYGGWSEFKRYADVLSKRCDRIKLKLDFRLDYEDNLLPFKVVRKPILPPSKAKPSKADKENSPEKPDYKKSKEKSKENFPEKPDYKKSKEKGKENSPEKPDYKKSKERSKENCSLISPKCNDTSLTKISPVKCQKNVNSGPVKEIIH